MIKYSAILISISAIAKAVCDKIRFAPGEFIFQNDWWLERGSFAWNNRTLLEKYIFSFISGGWHLFDAIRIVSLLILVSMLLVDHLFKQNKITDDMPDTNKGWAVALTIFLAYCLHGIVFEITFNLL